jgi:hypothetical protein
MSKSAHILVTARWSRDGANWTTEFSRDLGAALEGLDQRVTLAGLSWFNPANSYADYDYVRVTPANTPPPLQYGEDVPVFRRWRPV